MDGPAGDIAEADAGERDGAEERREANWRRREGLRALMRADMSERVLWRLAHVALRRL